MNQLHLKLHVFKRIFIAMTLLGFIPLTASAKTFTINSLQYYIVPNTTTPSVSCQGPENKSSFSDYNMTVPSIVKYNGVDYKVISIASSAFQNCTNLRGNLTIPNSVENIGSYAFYICTGLTGSLTIPNSVTKIGEWAFHGCSGFTGSLTIPNSVTEIGKDAFSGCRGFTGSLNIPNSVTEIGSSAFEGCRGFTGSLNIPNSVTVISGRAFYGCSGFTGSLNIPNSVTEIGSSAFRGCSGFTGSLNIPNSVTVIGDYAFQICSGFTGSLTIPNSVTAIGQNAFSGCTGLSGPLVIGNSVDRIGVSAFIGVTPDFIVLLPENVPSGVSNLPSSGTVYVPANSLEKYRNKLGSNRTILPIEISIDVENRILKPGEAMQLTPVIVPPDFPNNNLTWSSSDTSVATVDNNGLVTGIKEGTVDITVQAYGQSSTLRIRVSNLTEITLSPEMSCLNSGENANITIAQDITGRTVAWTSSDSSVAIVDQSGNVTAKKVGKTTITATLDTGISASATVYVANLTMKKETTLGVGESETLEATILPEELADRKIVWSTSDDLCVRVDQQGNITVVGFGSAVITAALADNPEVKASCTVKVSGGDTIGYYYDSTLNGVVITSIPDVVSYIIPMTVSAQDNKTYTVKAVNLESMPKNLKKIAYPVGVTTNFGSDIVKIAYEPECIIADGVITEPITGELVYVDLSVSGTFEITADVKLVGPDAFAGCSNISELKIADNSVTLSFHSISGSEPALSTIPLTKLYVGRNISYLQSPFGNNKTLRALTFGQNVTEIGDNMFNGCSDIREVSLPANIVKVGQGAFANCQGLSQFIIENGSTPIEINDAFAGSTMDYLYYGRQAKNVAYWPRSIRSIEIGGRFVDTLRDSEFTDMSKLYSLTIGSAVRVIDPNAFKSSTITKVLWLPNTPPEGYQSIKADIYYVSTDKYKLDESKTELLPSLSSKFFTDGLVYVINGQAADKTCSVIDSHYDRYLTALDIPHKLTYQGIEFTVESINDYALYCNKYFTSASIGDGIKSIGRFALYNCAEISSAPYIGKSVEIIDDYAFNSCSKIPSILIPDATKYLGEWSLANCSDLTSCLLGKGLEIIETGCFANDVSLGQLIVPSNVSQIQNQVFDNCKSFSYLEISNRTSTLTMGYSKHNALYQPSDGTIGGLSTAGVPLFADCPLREVYIGGDISYSTSPADGYSPFYRNDYLLKVIIYNHETEISDNEFYGCRNLNEVIVGNDVIRVGDYSFSGCLALEYFTLGSHVESIGTDAFSDCVEMKELKSLNRVPPVCGDQATDDIDKFQCTLYVPKEAVAAYTAADQWKNFFHIEGVEIEPVFVESITLDPQQWSGCIDETLTIRASIQPGNADNKSLSWSSSNIAVATVDEDGLVTIIGEGTCVITARANDGSNVTATCEIEGLPKSVSIESITHDSQQWNIYNLRGVKLNIQTIEEFNKLLPGIYIVNGKKIYKSR